MNILNNIQMAKNPSTANAQRQLFQILQALATNVNMLVVMAVTGLIANVTQRYIMLDRNGNEVSVNMKLHSEMHPEVEVKVIKIKDGKIRFKQEIDTIPTTLTEAQFRDSYWVVPK